jgi:long-chain acyl-CoA synthetase
MYTSGSTGKPKGVVMSHAHLVAGVSGMAENVHLDRDDVYVSYLPLAHILAFQVENVMIINGATICYSDPRELAHSMPMFKPTVFAGVPKVYDILKSGLEKKIAAGPHLFKLIFQNLIDWKIAVLQVGLDTPVSNIMFKIISKKVFGRVLKFGVTGGGPMNETLYRFCVACFCCPIIQGYALTETSVGGCFQSTKDTRYGVVGPPVPCVEAMVQSEPGFKDSGGLPYLYTDSAGGNGEAVLGRGEICFRGPCVSYGYYKLPDKTKEDYDVKGWFHTGDIGQFTADGVIQIIDRKKNLVKLKSGEYVALESMESAFVDSPFAMAVCAVADGDLDGPLVIVRANNHKLKQWATENNVAYKSMKELAERQETRNAVVDSMVEAGRLAGLTALELRVQDCAIITDAKWTPGHGMTATMKIDRRQILAIHADELNAMLKRNGVYAAK